MEPLINVKKLEKIFFTEKGGQVKALDAVDLSVNINDFICIVGPSGCGKSTMLRIIAGLEEASGGEVLYHGKPITSPGKERGMVFQEYSLLPWRPVIENVGLGLEFAGVPLKKRQKTALEYLRLVGLESFKEAYPYELSGGMQQRVAIARALANNPEVLLMDEPFGALDAHTRIILQKELLRIWQNHQKTILFVTHSVDEAVYLADKIIVMSARPGQIKQIISVDMPRPRKRSNPLYGELTTTILGMLDEELAKAV
ncbi:MAG: ABC transporter ATP-binding protein [Aminobacterium sp.]|nr:ABC transporter ATP-binding protein [Aminobacterium sp.]